MDWQLNKTDKYSDSFYYDLCNGYLEPEDLLYNKHTATLVRDA